MKRTCTISTCIEPETKEKATFLAKKGGRTLSGYTRRLIKQDIRAYEVGNGPILEKGRVP